MRSYRTVTVKQEELDGIICNACGGKIVQIASSVWEDHLAIEKSWGYGSSYDGEIHRFDICENCYNDWIKTFAAAPTRDKYL